MKKRYELTYGYKAVVTVQVKSESEEEARKLGLAKIQKMRAAIKNTVEPLDDSFNINADGILDMDQTWGLL